MVIEAAPGKVWEMLTNSKYVAQWDELPEHDPEESMTGGKQSRLEAFKRRTNYYNI